MAQGPKLYKRQTADCLRTGLESDGPGFTSLLPPFTTGVPHFIVLHFTVLRRYCVLYKLRVRGNLSLNKSIGSIVFNSI